MIFVPTNLPYLLVIVFKFSIPSFMFGFYLFGLSRFVGYKMRLINVMNFNFELSKSFDRGERAESFVENGLWSQNQKNDS